MHYSKSIVLFNYDRSWDDLDKLIKPSDLSFSSSFNPKIYRINSEDDFNLSLGRAFVQLQRNSMDSFNSILASMREKVIIP